MPNEISQTERAEWMAIVWPLEEFLAGRITEAELRETVGPLLERLSQPSDDDKPLTSTRLAILGFSGDEGCYPLSIQSDSLVHQQAWR